MRSALAAIIATSVFFVGCATVREVKSKPGKGGELAVHEGIMGESADIKSARIMKSNCPKGYKIVEKGEEVVGTVATHSSKTKSKSNAKSNGTSIIDAIASSDGESKTEGNSETTNKTEWRVKYECKKKGASSDD
ncbi:MAG: hypothetical protein H7318_00025 [Oligoflexus sp.]|nr:hypothetical protein [Oligoflexus sp.]